MLTHLTTPRLATIQSFFRTGSDTDTFGCYAWNQAIGAGLLPIIGDFEVAFRNAVHRALSQHYGQVDSFGWMMRRPNPAHASNPAAPPSLSSWHKMSPRSVSDVDWAVEKIKDKKPAGYIVTPDDVVAALPFGFWEVIVDSLDWKGHPANLKMAVFRDVFPHAPDIETVPFTHQHFRERVKELLKRVRDVRNRLGHHDALWAIPEFNEFGIIGFVPRRPRHTVISVRLFAARVCWFAGWIDPAISDYIARSDHWSTLHIILDRRALVLYRRHGGMDGTFRAVMDADELLGKDRYASRKPLYKFHERQLINSYFY